MTRATSDAHARLAAACGQPGCPVCRCVADASRRYLQALLHEQVTDVETRRRLRGAGGFCAGHAWMLEALPGAAFGAAILHEDLLRLAIERFEHQGAAATSPRGWLARVTGEARAPAGADPRADPGACLACADAAGAEARTLDAMLELAAAGRLETAYGPSDGVCVPHMTAALERGRQRPGATPLLDATLPKWKALREALARFVAKHDHRNREPVAPVEARALRRALVTLRGGLSAVDPPPGGAAER